MLDTEKDVMKLLEGKYKDPEAAYKNLWQLDEEGQQQLRDHPETIGELRRGVDPNSVDTASLAEFSHSFELVKPGVRNEVSGHKQELAQHEARMEQQREVALAKSPEARASESLKGAMSISHHASI